MEAHKKSLSDILSVDIRLVAPLFQRPYVWEREANWEPLWVALSEVFERRLIDGLPRPYFLGALVLDHAPTPTGSVACREIIDGQQRMTTLQVFLEQARLLFEEVGLEFQAKQLEKMTRNDLEHESDERFKVWPTNVDRDQFRSVMMRQPAKGRLRDAAAFFEDVLKNWVGDQRESAKDKAAALVTAVKNDLVFVVIDLDNDDDGQLIFETLNSLGTPLLPSDLVKNLLFRVALSERLDTERLFSMYWKRFEQEQGYWRGPVRVGRRERVQLDVFLQHYLTLKLGKEPEVAHQFRNYRDAFKDGRFGSTEDALRDFAQHAEHYRAFDERRLGAAASDLRTALEILDISVLNPLILGIIARVNDDVERDKMLRIVESYLMRRFLCAVTTKNYNRITADIVAALDRNSWNAQVLAMMLSTLEGSTVEWPTDEFVVFRTCERQAYGDIRGVGIAYVLARVEDP